MPDPPFPARKLLAWFDRARRDLPWRLKGSGVIGKLPQHAKGIGNPLPPAKSLPTPLRPDPYRVLVSEAMLQQTQVATVIPYFNRFMAELPTLAALAAADEQQVLRLWQGLGYYSRARNLRKAAIAVMERFGGQVPADVDNLQSLPGIGRYTAGAVASIAFDTRAPIVDGNVARVLCRFDAITQDPRKPAAAQRLWNRAEAILPKTRIGDFNSALMELGAIVCTPRSPKCLICPLRSECAALAAGLTDQIPPARKAKPLPLERRLVLCLGDSRGRYLIEQRPPTGRWAGLWQFITRPLAPSTPAPQQATAIITSLGLSHDNLSRLETVRHQLSHRRYEFIVFRAQVRHPAAAAAGMWTALDELGDYPLSQPQLRLAGLLHEKR